MISSHIFPTFSQVFPPSPWPSYGLQGRIPHGWHGARVGGPGAHGDDPSGGPLDANGISVLTVGLSHGVFYYH